MKSSTASFIESILQEYVKRVIEKARAGKRLSDWEIGMLNARLYKSYTTVPNRVYGKALSATIASLAERIELVEERLDKLEERTSNMEKGISRLEHRVGKLEKEVSDLGKRIDDIEKE